MLLSAAGIGNTLGRVLGTVLYLSSYHIWQFVPKIEQNSGKLSLRNIRTFATIGEIISRIDRTLFFASAIQVLVLSTPVQLSANSDQIFNDEIYCKSPQKYNGKFLQFRFVI